MADDINKPIEDNLDSIATGGSQIDRMEQQLNQRVARAKMNRLATHDVSPQQAGAALRIGKQLQIPPMLALGNESTYNARIDELALERLPQDFPVLLDWIGTDPLVYATSKEEREYYQAIESAAKQRKRDVESGGTFGAMGRRIRGNLQVYGASLALDKANDRGTPEERQFAQQMLAARIRQLEAMPRDTRVDAAMAEVDALWKRGDYGSSIGRFFAGFTDTDELLGMASMLIESGAVGAAGALIEVGATVDNPERLASLEGGVAGAAAVLPQTKTARRIWDTIGDDWRKRVARGSAAGLTTGALTYSGAYPSYIVEGWNKEEFANLPLQERAAKATEYAKTKAAAEGLTNAAISSMGGLVLGGVVRRTAAQATADVVAGGAGAAAASLSVGEDVNAADVIYEAGLEAPGAVVSVAAADWAQRKADAYSARLRADIERSSSLQQTLGRLVTSASNATSRENAPGTLAQFVDLVVNHYGNVPPELGISAGHLLEAVGEEGIADLRTKSETFDQQIDEALASDGEITLPTGEFVEWSAGLTPEQQKALAENVRERAGALTVREAEEARAELDKFNQESVAAEENAAADEIAAGHEIYTQIYDDLTRADKERAADTGVMGVGDAANKQYATLLKHGFMTLARRTGMSPRELFARFYGGIGANEDASPARTKVYAKNNRATLDDFRPENIGNVLNKTHWAIISAMNPAGETAPDAENKANHDRLIAKLREKGYEFVESVGNYGGILENSVVVTGISEIEADALGRAFGQDSVLSPRGYIYGKDTTLRPISGPAEVFSTAPSDNYTSIPSLGSNFTFPIDWNMTPQPTTLLPQSVPLRRGTQTLRKYGLDPSKRHNTRDVAAALEARQRDKYGSIPAEFESKEQRLEAEKKIARWMAEEVEFEMEDPANTATGWYSEKFQRALDIMAEVYPELKTDKVARDTLTLLIAITSDGQKVQGNFLQAMDIYGNYRTGGSTEGRFTTGRGHQRQASINNNLSIIQRLHDTMGAEKMHQYLMQEKTVKELKKAARDAGGKFDSAYLVTETVPMAALELGEKLGAFYANLMGAHGYLTMDRWWSRTFNRYRGTLLTNATPGALAKFRETIGKPELSDDETLAATIPQRNALAARGYKTRLAVLMGSTSQPQGKAEAEARLAEARARAGDQFDELYKEHIVERSANTIYKEAFEKLNDIPFNGSDRSFMIAATKRAQKLLKRRGIDTSVADIQAILWYYEKQLYGDLGARQSGKLSYEEASRRVVDAVRSGNAADLAAVRAGVGEESDEDGVSLGDEEYRVDDTKVDQLAYRGDVKGRVAFTRDAKAESRTGRQLNGWGLYLSSSEASAQGYAGTTGEVYRFEIPDNDALMDFDTGVGYRNQPQQVVDALLRLSNRLDNAELADKLRKSLRTPGGKFTGEALYRELTDEEFFGNQKAASLALYEVGILGHKYTTPTRGANAVTQPEDFVIYNGDDVRLITRDDAGEAAKLQQFEQGDLFEEAKSIEEQERAQAEAKGLDMSTEARMARAKEMGFDTSRRWYHASRKAGFREFNLPKSGKTLGTGIFMTDSSRMAGTYMPGLSREARIGRPDEIVANPDAFGFEITETEFGEFLVGTPDGYQQVFQSRQEMMDFLRDDARFAEEPAMYELFVRLDPQNVLTIDWQGRNWSQGPTEKVWNIYDKEGDIIDSVYSLADAEEAVDSLSQAVEFREEEEQLYETTDDAARQARDMGYDAVEIINVEDPGPYSSRIGAVEGTTLVVFDPANIRSTNAAFDPAFSTSADLLAQEQEPIFYSALERGLEQTGIKVANADRWIAQIKKLNGVKKAEIEAIGLEEYLRTIGGDIAREQVLEFVRQNGVRVEEVRKGLAFTAETLETISEELRNLWEKYPKQSLWPPEVRYQHDELQRRAREIAVADPRRGSIYPEYQLPGGEKYGELLLTLPLPTAAEPFRSSHWKEPNVLAHVRFNIRTGPNGEKILHIEEIQSDWHQAGREKGYDRPGDVGPVLAHYGMTREQWDRIEPGLQHNLINNAPKHSGVPDAPFKETGEWVNLVLKRMMRHAVDNGFDAVTFTGGELQADRYKEEDEAQQAKRRAGMIAFYDHIVPSKLTSLTGGKVESFDLGIGSAEARYILDAEDVTLDDDDEQEVVVRDAMSLDGVATFDNMRDAEAWIEERDTPIDTKGLRITDKMRERFGKAQPLFQQRGKKRGSFDVRTFRIALMDPNKSTAIHEMGHFFFEMMLHLAADPDAPQQIVDDVNAMLKFLKFEGTAADYLKVPVPQRKVGHETMAEHFEAYLRSGKAPTVELQGLFRTFARFLIEVYGAMQRMIGVGKLGNVDMDEELRAIFDRMLATDEAIEQSAKIRALVPQFESAEQAGMTDEEFAEYQTAVATTRDEAEEKLRARMMRDMKWLSNLRAKTLRELTEDAKAKRKAVRDEVTAEVDRMRVYRLQEFLKRGTLTDENGEPVQDAVSLGVTKLNKAALEALYPNGEVDLSKFGFGKYGMTAVDGVDPGVVAGLFGYGSVDEMVRDIVNAEKRSELIDGLTEQRMLERHADIATQEDLQRAADEAIASEAHTRMVATELAALDARQGSIAALRKAAKYAALGLIGRRTLRNTRPDLSSSAATRSRKDSAKALAAGKRDEAAAAKRNELLHVEMERQGREVLKERDKFLRLAAKIWKGNAEAVSKSRDVDLVVASRMVLGRYGIGSPGGMANAARYADMLAKYGGPHTQQVQQMTANLPTPKDYRDLTVDEFRQVVDIASGLYEMAKNEKTVTIDGKKVAIDQIADSVVATIEAKHGGHLPIAPGTTRTATKADERIDALQSLRANLTRVETWANLMGDIFVTAFKEPVLEAITKYRARRTRMIKAYKELVDTIAPTLTFKPIAAPELKDADGKPFVFSAGKSEILHAILHTGNDSNKRKLLLGRGWARENADGTLNTTQWDAFIARMIREGTLTKADYDFAQSVWDLLETLKPDAQAAHKAVYGFYFNEITANEFVTPFGTYRGGYVPAVVDPREVSEAESKKDAEELLQSGNSFAFPSTNRGFTKSRVEYNRPLHLDLRVLASHIDKVCRFTDVQPAVRDVAKLVTNKRIANALNRHDNKVVTHILVPWLQVAANQTTTKPGVNRHFDKLISTIDSRTGMGIMFASVINTLQQLTGFSVAAVKSDPSGKRLLTAPAVLRSLSQYLRNPKEHAALAHSRSEWLRDRATNQTMELRGAIDDILVNPNVVEKAQNFFARNAYFLQVSLQNVMDPILFNAAYEQAIARGASPAQARRAGEELIRTTQGSFAAEDVSRVEINTPLVRSMLKFYGYFNMWGNLLGSEANKAMREAGYAEPTKRLAFLYFAGLAIPAYMASLIAGQLPDDEDDEDGDGMLDEYLAQFFGVQGQSMAAMVPGVGPVTNLVVNLHNDKPYDDRLNVSPLFSTTESAVRSADNLLRGEYLDDEVTKREVRDMSTLIALAVGIPTGPLARMYGYEKDVETGRIEERGTIGDVWGYATGK